jgi:hypothetical protein
MIATVGDLGGITDTRAGLLLQLQRTVCSLVLSLALAIVLEKSTNERNFPARIGHPRELGNFRPPNLYHRLQKFQP